MAADVSRGQLEDVLRRIDEMRAEFDEIHGDPYPFDDDDRERLRASLQAKPDEELLGMFMTLHKTIENAARGRLRSLIERETVFVSTVLERFAPITFDDVLSTWFADDNENAGDDA